MFANHTNSRRIPLRQIVLCGLLLYGCRPVVAQEGAIPVLAWEARSDWMNVRQYGVKGDGVTDDTAAIQAVFDRTVETDTNYAESLRRRVVYFPAGQYRLTQTLVLAKSHGAWVVGHGRDTVLVWDGAEQGIMLWNNGATYARYEGLTWDGRGTAAVGVEHKSMHYYETCMRYQHCAFLNFTEHGVLVGRGDEKVATAEMWFLNCLFRNCSHGVSFCNFNDYDNTFDGCQFEDCGVGVNSVKGNFYLRASRFWRSRDCDVQQLSPSHASSLRFCTSQGSKRFFRTMPWGHLAMKIQDCRIDAWTASDGAIQIGHRGPTTIFDCTFTNPPSAAPPLCLNNPPELQNLLIVSNNSSPGTSRVVDPGPNSRITEVPPGQRTPVLADPARSFLCDTPWTSPKVFDAVRDFGAIADNTADDTAAVQACIDAAKTHGNGAIAYLPGGQYKMTRTLQVTGGGYGICGTGFRSMLNWAGEKDGTLLRIDDPQDLRLEHFVLQGPPETIRIHHTAGPGASLVFYDGIHVNGLEQCRTGLWCDRLPEAAVALMGHVIGNVRLTDCGPATILCAQHYYSLTLEGTTQPKTGIAGFMFHNDACHNYALDVLDNQDVVVADFYSESNQRYLLAEGQPGQPSGRVTIGASKISTIDREAITIRNYQGRIFVGGGDGWWQSDTSQPLEIVHEGERPVDFVIAGQMWWRSEPLYRFGPGLRYASVENLLMENQYPQYNEMSLSNVTTPTTSAALVGALDDFRELGSHYLRHYFPE
ncbi:MAG: glycosyl hydrolase family 28-related protein [Pirellulaceae bacterium]